MSISSFTTGPAGDPHLRLIDGVPFLPRLARSGASLHAIPPVAQTTPTMSHCKNYDFRGKILIHNAEGKLSEGVFSEIPEVNWPAMRSFSDSFYRLPKRALKVNC